VANKKKPAPWEVQEDRIRKIFGFGKTDDLPAVNSESLLVFYRYLSANAPFPCEAEYSRETGPALNSSFSITVLRLIEPGKYSNEDLGLFCAARQGRRTIELPLADVEVEASDLTLQGVDDYAYWFENW
jgi:hypothetical protein